MALFGAETAYAQALQPDGTALYEAACASCHGLDGRGRTVAQVGFDTPLPDFSDCSFASREPNGDWFAIIHEGGPRRAFNRIMPAFGDALSAAEIEAILGHIRSFCTDARWPRGDFNVPLAMFTEKAFPEDEAVWRTSVDTEGGPAFETEIIYEKRFGPRGQLELVLPFNRADLGSGQGTQTGIGDIEVGWKQNIIADLDTGSIFSLGGAAILPTGDESKGFGSGAVALEPFALFAQLLPGDAFLQGQLFAEFPFDNALDDELGWRGVAGKTWAADMGFGRAWTPMVEVLGTRELAGGAKTEWDIVPQVQVSLSQRQHVLLNVGTRLPVSDAGARETQFVFYLIWDWYDGGFLEGWR